MAKDTVDCCVTGQTNLRTPPQKSLSVTNQPPFTGKTETQPWHQSARRTSGFYSRDHITKYLHK